MSDLIDAYIAAADPKAQPILRKIRRAIRKAAPTATEIISYRMPAFRQNGVLLYFAAFKAHIGIYPPIRGDNAIDKALASYRGPKGNLQLPLDQPIPYDLIARIVKLRLAQDSKRKAVKRAPLLKRKRASEP